VPDHTRDTAPAHELSLQGATAMTGTIPREPGADVAGTTPARERRTLRPDAALMLPCSGQGRTKVQGLERRGMRCGFRRGDLCSTAPADALNLLRSIMPRPLRDTERSSPRRAHAPGPSQASYIDSRCHRVRGPLMVRKSMQPPRSSCDRMRDLIIVEYLGERSHHLELLGAIVDDGIAAHEDDFLGVGLLTLAGVVH
jgi:hypothetical protein